MPIKRVSICDVCGKQKDTHLAVFEYFIHNVSHVYCSKRCYEKLGDGPHEDSRKK